MTNSSNRSCSGTGWAPSGETGGRHNSNALGGRRSVGPDDDATLASKIVTRFFRDAVFGETPSTWARMPCARIASKPARIRLRSEGGQSSARVFQAWSSRPLYRYDHTV